MDQQPLELSLQATNIGPHRKLAVAWHSTGSTVVFARNGSGKTFLSRMFRLQQEVQIQPCDNLLTSGEDHGTFIFSASEPSRPAPANLSFELRRGSPPELIPSDSYLFHVFNGEYVNHNLAERNYVLSGSVPGYIVGGQNIDLSSERARLNEIALEGGAIKNRLEEALDEMRAELKRLGVRANMREFKDLTLETLCSLELPGGHQFDIVSAMLEDLSEVDPNAFRFETAPFTCDASVVDDVQTLLSMPCSRSMLAADFVEKITADLPFYTAGVRLVREGDGSCPFCGSSLTTNAEALIASYNAYLDDEEARVKNRAQKLSEQLVGLLGAYRAWETVQLRNVYALTEVCALIPSLMEVAIPEPQPSSRLEALVGALNEQLAAKAADVTRALDASEACDGVRALCVQATELTEVLDQMGTGVRARLNKLNDELREARKNLCVQALAKLRLELNGPVVARAEKQAEYVALRAQIREREAGGRVERRALVAERMTSLVAEFFGNKYSFDENTFSLLLNREAFPSVPDRVLSDGEKTILAFCYYLASVPTVVSHTDDWNNLFFVMDDPVSGLDAANVAKVAEAIAGLDAMLAEMSGQEREVRVLVLTHNTELVNALMQVTPEATFLSLEDGRLR